MNYEVSSLFQVYLGEQTGSDGPGGGVCYICYSYLLHKLCCNWKDDN